MLHLYGLIRCLCHQGIVFLVTHSYLSFFFCQSDQYMCYAKLIDEADEAYVGK